MAFKRRGWPALLAAVASLAIAGCISEHNFGTQNPSVVPPGSLEGDVYTMHGCPDQIIEIGNPVGEGILHWNKYLLVYRVAYGSKLLGTAYQEDAFENYVYLIENGKVVDGNRKAGGSGQAILMSLSSARHPRNRVGYGGDSGYPGSYGQSGRRGAVARPGSN